MMIPCLAAMIVLMSVPNFRKFPSRVRPLFAGSGSPLLQVSILIFLAQGIGGCFIPLPGATPTTVSRNYTEVPLDLTHLCGGKNSQSPIHPGVAKTTVHEVLMTSMARENDLGPRVDPLAATTTSGTLEKYWFHSKGKLLFICPNPEGGLIGITSRRIEYVLEIDYDNADIVRGCSVSQVWQGWTWGASSHPIWSLP